MSYCNARRKHHAKRPSCQGNMESNHITSFKITTQGDLCGAETRGPWNCRFALSEGTQPGQSSISHSLGVTDIILFLCRKQSVNLKKLLQPTVEAILPGNIRIDNDIWSTRFPEPKTAKKELNKWWINSYILCSLMVFQ